MINPEVKPGSWKDWSDKHVKKNWLRYIAWIEWICEWTAYWLHRWALVDVLDLISKLAILYLVFDYVTGIDDRKDQQVQSAWQAIYSATGQGGDGGRKLALEFLNKNNISLRKMNLTNADLFNVNLENANLSGATFDGSTISDVSFKGASIRKNASFKEVDFDNVDFSSTKVEATFEESTIRYVKFIGAEIDDSSFKRVDLDNVDFSNSEIYDTNFDESIIIYGKFIGAIIVRASFKGLKYNDANFASAKIVRTTFASHMAPCFTFDLFKNLQGAELNYVTFDSIAFNEHILNTSGTKSTIFKKTTFINCFFEEVDPMLFLVYEPTFINCIFYKCSSGSLGIKELQDKSLVNFEKCYSINVKNSRVISYKTFRELTDIDIPTSFAREQQVDRETDETYQSGVFFKRIKRIILPKSQGNVSLNEFEITPDSLNHIIF